MHNGDPPGWIPTWTGGFNPVRPLFLKFGPPSFRTLLKAAGSSENMTALPNPLSNPERLESNGLPSGADGMPAPLGRDVVLLDVLTRFTEIHT